MREQHALQLLEYLYILYTTFNVFKYSTPFTTTEMIRLGFARRIQLSAGHGLKHWVFNQTVHEYDESRMTACVIWGFFLCLPHLVGVLKRLVSTQLLDCGCTNLTKSLHPNYGIHLNLFLNFTHKK